MADQILVASRDADLCVFFGHILAQAGFRSSVIDPQEVVDNEGFGSAKAIILDGSDHMETVLAFCRHVTSIPADRRVPIMALLKARDEDRYLPLMKAGVDQCVMRPLAPDFIISGLTGMLKTHSSTLKGAGALAPHGPELITVDETRQLVGSVGTTHLTPTEYRLLKRLLTNAGHVVSRAELIGAAWPLARQVEPRTVDVHIGKLRRALRATTGRQVIRTIRASGFIADVSDGNTTTDEGSGCFKIS
ncbi:MAG: winged helix-turn-helix domain-containing protein [Pseudorhizobium sp.]